MFISSKFEGLTGSESVFYNHGGPGTCHYRNEKKFVARFKRGGKASFIKFLKANFTPDEYFARLEIKGETPFEILMSKGWVSPMAKKAKKRLMAMMLESKPVRSYDESWVKINGK